MMRVCGNSQFNFIFGRMIDGAAESIGMDPIDLTIKNFTHVWGTVPDKSLQGVLAAELSVLVGTRNATSPAQVRYSTALNDTAWDSRCIQAGMPNGRRSAADRCR
jgi:CO/xanthine dehydrogenase Mo-binding subunit